ncbi:hypothetical protein EOD39_17343 [Acipenser ruthenus]|uniref:Uncharacterized protein n=1 Tax=Acipenser ruthenus TaxID=7906 RepID=A0A444V3N5_ACIRT|nr:hypothetical protein EOD39_17343 [Acipenser ruthenus]
MEVERLGMQPIGFPWLPNKKKQRPFPEASRKQSPVICQDDNWDGPIQALWASSCGLACEEAEEEPECLTSKRGEPEHPSPTRGEPEHPAPLGEALLSPVPPLTRPEDPAPLPTTRKESCCDAYPPPSRGLKCVHFPVIGG